ncbi:Hypothetical predicted protein [Cloeon dipterum]|uniref:Cysteine sulfinic acid decarboxylase n=1 Tax=Cloeon dipterum TaxID=197152 RepID=A0A8S1DEG0_9INSE|nr:Hypothetical predicted protein [Cloeon dipterum]
MEWFRSIPDETHHRAFLKDVLTLVLDEAVFKANRRGEPVIRWRLPQELLSLIDVQTRDQPASHEELLAAIKATIDFSVKTGHPMFINQLYSGLDPYGLAGQWVTDALNPSSYTYEVAPVFTTMEEAVLQNMRALLGYPDGRGDGIFCPGGSLANGCAMNLARFKAFPSVKTEGLHGLPRLVLFASEDAHYSIHKMAALEGLGEAAVRSVTCDSQGRMDLKALEAEIQVAKRDGVHPFMVVATAGTTVLGALDPLSAIADVCSTHGLWLHVDAAWGGGLLFSKEHRHLLAGIERADSVAWNPHKLLAVPQQCSTLLVRHEGLLKACHGRDATYLFQKDKFYDHNLDPGDKYIQCGRRVDVFKFWLMWKGKGSLGLGKHVDAIMELSRFLIEELKKRADRFKLVLETPNFVNVSFWYLPQSIRNLDPSTQIYRNKLQSVAPKIKEGMMKAGTMMLGYQPLRQWPNFFRFVTQNSGMTKQDVIFMLDEIERLGDNL